MEWEDVTQCNAYVYSAAFGGSCTLYGPEEFLRHSWEGTEAMQNMPVLQPRPYKGWDELAVQSLAGPDAARRTFVT